MFCRIIKSESDAHFFANNKGYGSIVNPSRITGKSVEYWLRD